MGKIVQDDTIIDGVDMDGRFLVSRVGHIDPNIDSNLENDFETMVCENQPRKAVVQRPEAEAQPDAEKGDEIPEPRKAVTSQQNPIEAGDIQNLVKKSLKSSTDKPIIEGDSDVDEKDPFSNGDNFKNLKSVESRESLKKYNICISEDIDVENFTVI